MKKKVMVKTRIELRGGSKMMQLRKGWLEHRTVGHTIYAYWRWREKGKKMSKYLGVVGYH
jgi:hypothetical protein